MTKSILLSVLFHIFMVVLTVLTFPFMTKKPIDLPPILSVELIQISDLTNIPLIEHIAKMNLPMIISTGLGTFNEIDESIKICNSVWNEKIAILHCVADYPANPE